MPVPNSTAFPPCVYFIRFGESGPIKIGKTNRNPRIRLALLQNGSPVRLHLMAIISEPDEDHSEEALHRRFAHLRIRGEWFDSIRELTDFIADHAEPCTVTSPSSNIGESYYQQDFECPIDESWHWDRVHGGLEKCRRPMGSSRESKRKSNPDVVRPRGRPVVSEDAVQRARHIECAGMMLLTNWSVRRVAASFGITRETAYQWYKLALDYDGAESEALRQLAASDRLNAVVR
jgi:hypothetical protein